MLVSRVASTSLLMAQVVILAVKFCSLYHDFSIFITLQVVVFHVAASLGSNSLFYQRQCCGTGRSERRSGLKKNLLFCYAHSPFKRFVRNSGVTPVLYPCYDVGVGGKVIWIRNVSFNVSNEVLLLNIIWTKCQFSRRKQARSALKSKDFIYYLLVIALIWNYVRVKWSPQMVHCYRKCSN